MIDQVALLPAYCAAGTAVLAMLTDLVAPGRRAPVLGATLLGILATAFGCWWAYRGGARSTFCANSGAISGATSGADPGQQLDSLGSFCSYQWNARAVLFGLLFAGAALVVLALSVPVLRSREVPPGEYCFLLGASLTGGVVLGAAGDLVTLIIALETLTLPLYILVGLRRRSVVAAEAAVTFFVVSVVSTAVTLMGAALLYAATGTVHIEPMAQQLSSRPELRSVPLVGAAAVLVLVGLAFKVAAVPFHAWAPATYDGAPLPIAAYLSTASKLGGVIAILVVAVAALAPMLDVAGPALAVLAVLTMTVGNLAALRQRRMVRLLAWSSVAQAGYILAPLGAFAMAEGRDANAAATTITAALAYTVLYILLELTAFGCLVALRGPADGGTLDDYRGAARQRPVIAGIFALAMTGLAGLPPGLAGLFAKITIVRSLLGGGAGWLALVVAVNAVVGLAYYLRAAAAMFARPASVGSRWPAVPVAVGVVLLAVAFASIVVGFAPQLVLDAVARP